MADYRNKTVCVIDNGLFCDLATLLAKSFGRTLLYVPSVERAFPASSDDMIGFGLEGVEKADHWSAVLDDVDLWIFPDVGQGALQEHLVSLGKRVWGSRMGEELELYRDDAKRHMKALGIPTGKYRVITGIDALRKFLKGHPEQHVKISRLRGDMETFEAKTYATAAEELDEQEYKLGPKGAITDFIVEEDIPDAVEIGYDGLSIDGAFPAQAMSGLEVKDRAYVGRVRAFDEIPEQLRAANEALAATLKQYQYRNFFSTEVRVTKDGTGYMVDPCCRFGSPPSQLMTYMIANLADVLWEGAAGSVVEPEWSAAWGAQRMVTSRRADFRWQTLEFPPALRDQVRLIFPALIKGQYHNVPQQQDMESVAAVVATGATMEEAVKNVNAAAAQVTGHKIDLSADPFRDAQTELDELKAFGVEL